MVLHDLDRYFIQEPPFDMSENQKDPNRDQLYRDAVSRITEIQCGGKPRADDPATILARQYLGHYEPEIDN